MRTFRSRGPALVAIAVLAGPLPFTSGARAQTVPSPYRFVERSHEYGVIFGVARENRGALGIGPGGGPLVGGSYAIRLRGALSGEITGFLISTDRVVYDVSPDVGLIPLGETEARVAALDARLRFTLTGARTWHGLAPFLMAGGGVVGDIAGMSPLDSNLFAEDRFSFGPSFLGIMGAGTRWIPGDRFTLRVETSFNLWKLSTPSGFSQVQEQVDQFTSNEWIGVGVVGFGASYRF